MKRKFSKKRKVSTFDFGAKILGVLHILNNFKIGS